MGNLAAFIWLRMDRMPRSLFSACSKCSINHFDDAVDVAPWAIKSVQALAMPCKRRALSTVAISIMIALHRVCHLVGCLVCHRVVDTSQAVVPAGVGQWHLLELQACLHACRNRAGIQARQHILNMLGTEYAGLDHQ